MLSFFRHRRIRSLAAWLALAAVLYRGLIPVGFMPVRAADAAGGVALAICTGGHLGNTAQHPAGGAAQPAECPFAFAAMASPLPALPVVPFFGVPAAAGVAQPAPSPAVRLADVRPPARGPPTVS